MIFTILLLMRIKGFNLLITKISRREKISIENAKTLHKFPFRGFTDKICECPTDNIFETRYIFFSIDI